MKIEKYEVDGDLILRYLKHLNSGDIDEQYRKMLHDQIFESVDLNRHSKEGEKFSILLDKWCDDMIINIPHKIAKRISRAASKDELDKIKELQSKQAGHELSFMQDKLQKRLNESDKECRICGRDLSVVFPRVNDHLTDNKNNKIKGPICSPCSRNKPDKHFIEFKKNHWD